MPIVKPQFTDISVSRLTHAIEGLEAKVRSAREPDGQIEMRSLRNGVATDAQREMLNVVAQVDGFQRERINCNGQPIGYTDAPHELEAAEVETVLQALLRAKSEVAQLDRDTSGSIDHDEHKAANNLTSFAGQLAAAAIAGELQASGYAFDLARWASTVRRASETLAGRKTLDREVNREASFHAETTAGKEASRLVLMQKIMTIASQGRESSLDWDMPDRTLEKAERHWLRWLPFFKPDSANPNQEGHLNDSDIRTSFGIDDLEQYAQDNRAAIESAWQQFLSGTNPPIDGRQYFQDADYLEHAETAIC